MALLYYCDNIKDQQALFDSHETAHLNVMRKKTGEKLSFTDGKGFIYEGFIRSIGKTQAVLEICEKHKDLSRELDKHIEITAGLSKWTRFSLLLEKSVELGVRHINLLDCDHSNLHTVNHQRVEKTLRKALKQCGGTLMPQIAFCRSIKQAQKTGIVPVLLNPHSHVPINHVDFPSAVNVFIGPEGGFSENELQEIRNFMKPVIEISLGERILRLETAAIVAISFIALSCQNVAKGTVLPANK